LRGVRIARGIDLHGAGDPARASELLERALAEPPAASLRPAVLRDLDLAELALGRSAARERLAEALGLAPEDVHTARALARSHLNAGDGAAAMDVLTKALDGTIEDPDLRSRLEAELGAIGLVHPARWLAADRRLEALPDSTARARVPGARQLAAVRAFAAFRRSAPVALVRRRAMAALVDREPDGELLATLVPLTMLITVLAGCDELAVAQDLCEAGRRAAARRGDHMAAT
jgi:tetratricopeptide (TPR) repeat protein